MPGVLWDAAIDLARSHGAHRVARALRVAYYSLKHRMTAAARPPARSGFVELTLNPPGSGAGCVVEVDRPDGARMTIRGAGQADLAALSRTFLEPRP
jgi:hypothetical protein